MNSIYELAIGQVVMATAGRDRNKFFVVIGIIDDEYVWIVNGRNRTLANPKKKKIKHLRPTKELLSPIRGKIIDGKPIFDSEIRKALQALGYEE